MKLGLALTVFALGISAPFAQAQWSIGPSLAGGFSKTCGMHNSKMTTPSFAGGLTVERGLTSRWNVGADVLYSREGYRASHAYKGLEFMQNGDVFYLRFNPKIQYNLVQDAPKWQPRIFAGPSLGVTLMQHHLVLAKNAAAQNQLNVSDIATPSFKGMDFGFFAGAGSSYKLAEKMRITADAVFYQGVLNPIQGYNFVRQYQKNTNSNIRLQVGLLVDL